MAEPSRLNDKYQFDLAPLVLNPFYSAKSYSTCCKSEATSIYRERFNFDSTYNFPPKFEDLNISVRKFLKENARTIQTIKKKNHTFKLLNEVVTVSAVPIRGEFCYCQSGERENFSHVYLPTQLPELNSEFWNSESEDSHRALTFDVTEIDPSD